MLRGNNGIYNPSCGKVLVSIVFSLYLLEIKNKTGPLSLLCLLTPRCYLCGSDGYTGKNIHGPCATSLKKLNAPITQENV